MEITTYAPVIIPTLNRYEHFKRCLESLEKCTGADKTDVYVALDYPPNDKYKEGWLRIDEYLKEKEKSHFFGRLIVIRRDHNYGVCHENGNYETLIREIYNNYDRYILSEDDNEFSPCFLEFQNKCLERFKDDPRINLVCGYNYVMDFPDMYINNFYISKYGCPWGTGSWVNKDRAIQKLYNFDILKKLLKDDNTYYTLKRRSPHVIHTIVSMLKAHRLWGDAIKGVYTTLFDTYCIMPRESMVRNHGNDGTGDHNKRLNKIQNDFYVKQFISKDKHFEFTTDIFTYEPIYLERHQFHENRSVTNKLKERYLILRLKIDIFLIRKLNYVPKSKYI